MSQFAFLEPEFAPIFAHARRGAHSGMIRPPIPI